MHAMQAVRVGQVGQIHACRHDDAQRCADLAAIEEESRAHLRAVLHHHT